ncbi:MAG: lactate dehydrogenase [Lachnospiraceae bacterium]|nr:lactate dehydrogenase [Lachnospiraceae bacterium]
MLILADQVREDEREYFEEFAKEYGLEIRLNEDMTDIAALESFPEPAGYSVLGMHHYGPEQMALLASKNIKYLSTRTIGHDHIDLDAARKYGVSVCNVAYGPNGVADYTVMMILLCLRKYKQALWRMQVNDFSLQGLLGRELADLTVGVLGTGRIGSAVIRELSGFRCRLIAYDKFRDPETEKYAEYVPFDTILEESDVITLHLPLLPETRHIINSHTIAMMKDGVVIINCARGPLADIKALTEGIETEKIGALGVDCIETEEKFVHQDLKTAIIHNPDIAYLKQFKNVVYTQHMAFYTDTAVRDMVKYGVLGILQMARGEECPTRLV